MTGSDLCDRKKSTAAARGEEAIVGRGAAGGIRDHRSPGERWWWLGWGGVSEGMRGGHSRKELAKEPDTHPKKMLR